MASLNILSCGDNPMAARDKPGSALRYDRQTRIPGLRQEALGRARVLVAGSGTGGSVAVATLALAGVGMHAYGGALVIADFDRLEEVNVTRWMLGVRPGDLGRLKAEVAAERARELNPDVNALAWPVDIVYEVGAAALARFDAVLVCVDNLMARLWLNRYAEMWAGRARLKAVIEGGLDGLTWAVHTFIPGQTACYECLMSEEEYAGLRRRYSCQGQALRHDEPPSPMSIVSAVPAVGAMVQELVHILCGLPPSYAGCELRFDANGRPARMIRLARRAECPGHWSLPPEGTLVLPFTAATPVRELRRLVGERLGLPPDQVTLNHDRTILYGQRCPRCGYCTPPDAPPTLFDLAPLHPCPECGGDLSSLQDQRLLRDELTLADHGVPEAHVLRAYTPQGEEFFLVPEVTTADDGPPTVDRRHPNSSGRSSAMGGRPAVANEVS